MSRDREGEDHIVNLKKSGFGHTRELVLLAKVNVHYGGTMSTISHLARNTPRGLAVLALQAEKAFIIQRFFITNVRTRMKALLRSPDKIQESELEADQ